MTVPKQTTAHRSKGTAPSTSGRGLPSAPTDTRTGSSWASYSRATMSGKQGGSEQDPTGPNKDEYLMNLFRREDMGYTNPQPSMFAQGSQSAVPSQSGQPGLNVGQSQPFTAFSAVNLPNYPGCGMLSRYGAHIVLPQQQQPQQQQQQRVPGLPVYSSDKVISRMGQQAYDDLRELVLHHQETFVEQLYDLHRLTRRQQHLEANCGQRTAYNAELQSLEAAQQGSAVAAAAVKDKRARGEATWRAHGQAQQEENAANCSADPSVERKGSNTPGESSDPAGTGSNRAGTNSHSNEQKAPPGGAGGVAASMLQQHHQNLKVAQANAAAATVEVQRQQGLLAAAAQAQHFSSEQNSMAAAAQVQAAQHQRSMDAAAESHSQHQQFMAAAAQAHMQHQANMLAAAQARAQHRADLVEAQMAYGSGSGGVAGGAGSGGSSGRRGTAEGSGSGQNAGQSMGMGQQDASRNSYMQAQQQQLQQQPNGTLGSHNGMGSNFQQGFNPMGMSGLMGGYGYGYGNGGNFYQGFGGCYPNMNGYHYNQYGMPAGAMCNFDPMQSWYMHHYGRGAAQATADAAQAAADGAAAAAEAVAEAVADAQAQQKAAAAVERANDDANAMDPDAGSSQQAPPVSSANVARWWQDPAQVFGPEVLPEVVARMSSPAQGHGGANGVSMRHWSASRPGGSKHERPTEDREVPGMRAPPKQRAKKANAGSGVPQRADEMTGQTSGGSMFGSGGSAFRKIPQRPRSVRSIARTNSIGSENSKSSFGANAAANQATGGDASPPKQMQSAANILVGFSGHNSPQQ